LSSATDNRSITSNPRYGYLSYGADANRTYDRAGSLTKDLRGTYQWDARHRLVEADLSDGTKLLYGYDALGRRVEKRKTLSGTTTTTNFFFDGWNAVEESHDGTLFRETIFGASLDDSLEYRLSTTPGGRDYELFRDARGSTAAVVDDDGTTHLFKYLPFGKASILTGTGGDYNFDLSTVTTTSLWQGLDLDPDLNWYYARNRWYDPETGSFTATDPLGYADSANSYAWGVGGPWAHDPSGLLCDAANASGVFSWIGRCAQDVATVYGYYAEGTTLDVAQRGLGVADLASGGRITGARRAIAAARATRGTTGQKLGAALDAYQQGREAVLTLGFSEAPDKLKHAAKLIGLAGVKTGAQKIGEGIGTGDVDLALRGVGELAEGTSQFAGTAAAVYAPFAPRPVPAIRPATQQPVGGAGIVLRDTEGATAAEIEASKVGPTAGKRVGGARLRQELIDEATEKGDLRCWRCGQTTTNPSNLHVGHRNVPRSGGGNMERPNVCLEGAACNLSAQDRGAPSPGMSCAERGSCGAPYGRSD
jgi:RHS repeat-associated protein